MLFFTVAAPVCIPTNSAKGSPFSTSLPTRVVSCIVDFSHSDRCEVLSRGSHLHFPDDEGC